MTYSKKTKKFTVTAHERKKDRMYAEEFDHVVVASGHFSTPNVSYFDGLATFNGRVMHSHDFRDALEFKGKDVLVVGRSYSAEDIGSQCWKYGAKSVLMALDGRPRVALHAKELTFIHPTRREELSVSSPFPADWPGHTPRG